MSPHWLLRAIALFGLLLFGGGAWAGEEAETRAPIAPPFLVSGTIISPPTRIALIVIRDEQGKAMGEVRLHEGETVRGYRITKIDMDQVVFERDGQTFPIRVRNEQQPIPVISPVVPYERKKERPATFVSPPDNIEEIRKQTETFMQQLRQSPEFQKGLEEVKRRFQERLEAPKSNP